MKDRVQSRKPGEEISRGLSHEFMCKFERSGGTTKMLQRAIEDGAFMDHLIQNWSDTQKEHVSLRTAQRSGISVYGVEEAALLGVSPKDHQRAALKTIPFSRQRLEQLRDTHILVAVFPLSIAEMRKRFGEFVGGSYFSVVGERYDNPAFFHYTGDTRWELIRKLPPLEIVNENRESQEKLLRERGEYVIDAQTLVYTMMVKFQKDRGRMFQNCVIRTRDLFDNYGAEFGRGGDKEHAYPHVGKSLYHVAVGHFSEMGISITNDSEGPSIVGAASAVIY